MPATTTVVTPLRFEQGLTYAGFLAQAAVNRDKFEKNYNHPALTEDDLSFFRKAAALAHGPRNLLAIAEAWCGDVYRELPTAVRIAEAAGLDLRVFLRDENPDIMDEFLSNNGKSRAIPVFVFLHRRYAIHHTFHGTLGQRPCWIGYRHRGGESEAEPPRLRFVRDLGRSGEAGISDRTHRADRASFGAMAQRRHSGNPSTVVRRAGYSQCRLKRPWVPRCLHHPGLRFLHKTPAEMGRGRRRLRGTPRGTEPNDP